MEAFMGTQRIHCIFNPFIEPALVWAGGRGSFLLCFCDDALRH